MTISKRLQFAVFQWGARLHYAVPSILESAGLLKVVYADLNNSFFMVKAFQRLPERVRPTWVRRALARRFPPNIPRIKLISYAFPTFQKLILTRLSQRFKNDAQLAERFVVGERLLSRKALKRGLDGANAVYTYPCVCTGILKELKERGIHVVLEAISHPLNQLVEFEELKRWGYVHPVPFERLRQNIEFFKAEVLQVDVVLAASPYVQNGLQEIGIPGERIATVPYGLEDNFFKEEAKPQPERALYVGNVGYLKGVHYFAKAARLLSQRGYRGEVRVVGPCDTRLTSKVEFAGPTYVGAIPDTRQDPMTLCRKR